MKRNSLAIALSVCAVFMLASVAPAQRKTTRRAKTVVRKVSASGAETGLAGIRLFDTGSRVVSVYGTPDEIQAVSLGGGGAGPGGGAAGGAGGANLPGRSGGGPPGAAAGASLFHGPDDFGFGNDFLDRQMTPGGGGKGKGGGGTTAGAGLGSPAAAGGGGGAGSPAMAGGGGASMPGGGGAGMGGGTGERIVYTRWVYNRNASKYGFILDKYNRVIQCEAIGIQGGKASTRRGITFGSNFAQIIKKYGAPDGYEIAGDNIVVRYLSKSKCAFRLSRLGENKPSVVTGIVVAAGKR